MIWHSPPDYSGHIQCRRVVKIHSTYISAHSWMSHRSPWTVHAADRCHWSANRNEFDLWTTARVATFSGSFIFRALSHSLDLFLVFLPSVSAPDHIKYAQRHHFTFLYLWGKVNLSMVVWTAPRFTLPSLSSSCRSSCEGITYGCRVKNRRKGMLCVIKYSDAEDRVWRVLIRYISNLGLRATSKSFSEKNCVLFKWKQTSWD